MGSQVAPTPVVDVSSADFEREVIERSRSVPVLVDFWAVWCGPCRALGPVLERLAQEAAGSWVLAKVDADSSPELVAGYGVRGIPAVLLFRGGELVDRFVGALPEAQIRAFLRSHIESEADREIARGRELLAQGDRDGARAAFSRSVELEDAGAAHVELARLALAEGDVATARDHAESVPIESDDLARAQSLIESIEIVTRAKAVCPEEECQVRLARNPKDIDAHYALGGWAVARAAYAEALEHFLHAAELDPQWEGEAARRAMLAVFQIIGVRDPLSDAYRDKLRRLYY